MASASRVEEFLLSVPKAELHLHVEGAMRWQTIRELHPKGETFPIQPPWHTQSVFQGFPQFAELMRTFIQPATGTSQRVARHVEEIIEDLAADGVRFADLSISTSFHNQSGESVVSIFAAADHARILAEDVHGIRVALVAGFSRSQHHLEAEVILDELLNVQSESIGRRLIEGIDLHGNEAGEGSERFIPLFQKANEAGLRLKAHAGEFGGANRVWQCINDLRVRHVCHGICAVEDPILVSHLAQTGVFLHICPTANFILGACESLENHPLKKLLKAGCRVTINSDDPLIFRTTLLNELRIANNVMGLGIKDLALLCRHAFEAAEITSNERQLALQQIADLAVDWVDGQL